MNQPATPRSAQAVAQELDISLASLRRWSDEFTDYLSRGAGINKGRDQRRYSAADVETLTLIKELMSDGLTYDQVRQELNGRSIISVESDLIEKLEVDPSEGLGRELKDSDEDDGSPGDDDSALITTANGPDSPAITFLTNTLATLADSQKSILNSQAANRELLGVLLQDNFNLKEENNRLRERILEVERDLAQSRQEEERRRETLRRELESKIMAANQLAGEAMTVARSIEIPAPEIKAIETKPGCLGMLFGRGGTQIITTSRRRKVDGHGQLPGVLPPQNSQPNPTSQPREYPKPVFPPE
jgi:DNA-binding transcriptional MerR regulator